MGEVPGFAHWTVGLISTALNCIDPAESVSICVHLWLLPLYGFGSRGVARRTGVGRSFNFPESANPGSVVSIIPKNDSNFRSATRAGLTEIYAPSSLLKSSLGMMDFFLRAGCRSEVLKSAVFNLLV